ncbi:Hypothetical predicted protein [Cloeon dipterum]|uniref:IGFBP N-terminal domain-containing protein n=1 Tax=Cloeon dipterum TaxID=197152 RepID=A0A8S1CYB4_9INSE|nr:Hypothetical predicted protein [Cloeon dipterum]
MQASLYKYSVISLASTLFGLIVIASIMTTAHSGPTRCGPCLQGTCVSNPDDCRYGHFHDSCGRIVCSKAPSASNMAGLERLMRRISRTARSLKVNLFQTHTYTFLIDNVSEISAQCVKHVRKEPD